MIPLHRPEKLTGKYLGEVLASRWLTTGKENERLKKELSVVFPAWSPAQLVLASSATAAFWALCAMLYRRNYRIGWLYPGTWPGMTHAFNSYFANVEGIPRVDVAVLTDIGGPFVPVPYNIQAAVLIRDVCHSWIPWADAAFNIASFYPTKLVSGAEGGVVFCRSGDDARELSEWLYCGCVPGRATAAGPTVPGMKGNMVDTVAALNREALELLPRRRTATQRAWARLAKVANQEGVPYQAQPAGAYLFQVPYRQDQILAKIARLQERGIGAAWNFPPLGLVSLPCYPGLSMKDAGYVIRTWKEIAHEDVK